MNLLGTFSGVGNIEFAAQNVGMNVVGLCENDKQKIKVLKQHFPNTPIIKDIHDVNADTARALGTIDIITGGFPCQDLSRAGKRAGLSGDKSGLWFEFWRVIQAIKPRFVLIENVPDLLSSKAGKDFAIVLAGLTGRVPVVPEKWGRAGFMRGRDGDYNVCWRVFDSQFFGLAQRRKRLFIVASLGDGSCAEVLLEQDSAAGITQKSKATQQKVAATPASSTHDGHRGERTFFLLNSDPLGYAESEVSSPLRASANKGIYDLVVEPIRSQALFRCTGYSTYTEDSRSSKSRASADNGTTLDLVVESIDARNLRSGGDISGTLQAKNGKGTSLNYINPVAIYYTQDFNQDRVYSADAVSPAITADKSGYTPNFLVNGVVRRLTPRECERLQGMPDDRTAMLSDSARYHALGDAVSVPVAEWILKRIVGVHQ